METVLRIAYEDANPSTRFQLHVEGMDQVIASSRNLPLRDLRPVHHCLVEENLRGDYNICFVKFWSPFNLGTGVNGIIINNDKWVPKLKRFNI